MTYDEITRLAKKAATFCKDVDYQAAQNMAHSEALAAGATEEEADEAAQAAGIEHSWLL